VPLARTIPCAQRAPLEYALSLPWPAFFCIKSADPKRNKRPACPRGFYDACQGEALRRLYRLHPGELVGVPTGEASGISVLDIDPDKGGNVWLDENRARLPATRMHETQRGGVHLLFNHRAGLKSSTSKIAPGVDTRGVGGYFISWPGQGFGVVDHPLANWPAWLKPPEPPPPAPIVLRASSTASNRYGAAALDRACAAIAGAGNGDQNSTVNRECFSIGSLVAGGVIERSDALNRLRSAARSMTSYDSRWVWSARETDELVERAFNQGLSRPRTPVRSVAR
jgi:Bifunctional DNA primase/polymerase, N-terminal